MRSPAPMYNVAMRWGGVGLSTYMQCRCSEAILFDTSKKEVNGYIVVHETARPFDRTAVASPRRTARESRDARWSHTAAQRPRRPTPGRTGHRARATTQHARQVAHDTPASHRGRAQGPGRGRGGTRRPVRLSL